MANSLRHCSDAAEECCRPGRSEEQCTHYDARSLKSKSVSVWVALRGHCVAGAQLGLLEEVVPVEAGFAAGGWRQCGNQPCRAQKLAEDNVMWSEVYVPGRNSLIRKYVHVRDDMQSIFKLLRPMAIAGPALGWQ